jgi:hypothetical protein
MGRAGFDSRVFALVICENGSEYSASKKDGTFLEQLSHVCFS